jgi:hypothetical protein
MSPSPCFPRSRDRRRCHRPGTGIELVEKPQRKYACWSVRRKGSDELRRYSRHCPRPRDPGGGRRSTPGAHLEKPAKWAEFKRLVLVLDDAGAALLGPGGFVLSRTGA